MLHVQPRDVQKTNGSCAWLITISSVTIWPLQIYRIQQCVMCIFLEILVQASQNLRQANVVLSACCALHWPLFWKRAKRHRCTKSFPVRWWWSLRYLSIFLRPSHHKHHIFSVKICTSPCSMACSYIFRFVPAWFLFSFTRISALPFLMWKPFLFQSPSPRLVRRLMTLSSRLGTGKTKVSISKSLRSQIQ